MDWIKRTTTFALIALLLSVSVAACGSDDDDTDAALGDETEVIEPTQAADEDATATEEDAGEATPTDGTPEPEAAESDTATTPMTDASPATGSPAAGTSEGAVTIDDILDAPEAFVEEEVAVTGEVVDVLMTGVFTISDEDDDKKLLVVGAGDLMPALDEDSFVRVRGQVDMLTIDDDFLNRLSEEFGIELEDDELLTEFDGQPVIAASSVSLFVTSIDELLEAPDQYIGQMVTLRGPVVEQLNPLSFVMSDQETDWIAEESLLVVGPSGVIPPEVDPEATYEVRGVVRILDPSDQSEFEEEFSFLIEDDAFADFEGSPLIVAESVEHIIPEDALATILDEPDTFIDRRVQVTGQVAELIGMSSFTVGSDDTDDTLLVIIATPTLPAPLSEGGPVTASGTIQRFDLMALEEDLGIELEDDLLADFDGEPVLVADMVMAEGS